MVRDLLNADEAAGGSPAPTEAVLTLTLPRKASKDAGPAAPLSDTEDGGHDSMVMAGDGSHTPNPTQRSRGRVIPKARRGNDADGEMTSPGGILKVTTGPPQEALSNSRPQNHGPYPAGPSRDYPLREVTVKSSGSARTGDQDGGGGASQSSGSTSATKALTRLRRVLGDTNNALLPGLWWLRIVGIMVTLLAIVLSVTIVAVTQKSFSSFQSNIIYVNLGGKRMYNLFSIVLSLQDLTFASQDWVHVSNTTVEDYRSYVLGNVTTFDTIHRSMISIVQNGNGDLDEYVARYVTLTRFDLPGAGKLGKIVYANLIEAGLTYSSLAAQAAIAPLSLLGRQDEALMKFLYLQGLPAGIVHESLHASMESGFSETVAAQQRVILVQIAVFSAMSGLLIIIGLIFIFIVRSIEKDADKIVVRFVELPVIVRKMLFSQSVHRLRILRRNYAGDYEDEEEDDDDEEGMGGGKELGEMDFDFAALDRQPEGALNEGDGEGRVVEEDEADVDWDQVLGDPNNLRTRSQSPGNRFASTRSFEVPSTRNIGGSGGSSSRRRRSSKTTKKYRKSSRSFLVRLARFIGPLIALFAFFATLFAASYITAETAFTQAAIATSAARRASCSREAVIDVRRAVSAHAENTPYGVVSYSAATDVGACLLYHQELLAFGFPEGSEEITQEVYSQYTPAVENGQSSYIDAALSVEVHDAQFADACVFIAKYAARPGFSLQRCRSFGGGILRSGLTSTIREMTRRMSILLDRRLRTYLINGADAEDGKGYMVPSETFDYEGHLSIGDFGAASFDFSARLPVPPVILPRIDFIGDVDSNWTTLGDAPAGTVVYSIEEEFASDDYHWLLDADELFVTPAVFALADIYQQTTLATLASFNEFATILVGVFLAGFVLFILLYFLPSVRHTNTDIQTKRLMLLYLPAAVVAKVPGIRALVKEILASGDNDAFTRGSGLGTAAAAALSQGGNASRKVHPINGPGHAPTSESAAARMSDSGVVLTRPRSFLGNESIRKNVEI